ncbi:MAG: hypothetical protein J6P53_03180, partial [Mailhella sp.]|nr:hypothetical protein [Mailhella sp.]
MESAELARDQVGAPVLRVPLLIRARFLGKIKEAFERNPALANLLLDPYFAGVVKKAQAAWRNVVKTAI